METKFFNHQVLYATEDIRYFDYKDINSLIQCVQKSSDGKRRICLHRDPEHNLHEMIIVLRKDVYYPPHRHPLTEESYFIIHGQALLKIYNNDGTVIKKFYIGDIKSGKCCFARICAGTFHCLTIESEILVYLETKLGPFSKQPNEPAPFWGGETERDAHEA